MKYLVMDSENNGLFNWELPADAPGQPRIASLACILLNDELEVTLQKEFLIKPDGWEMTKEATAVNGLTTEFLQEHGSPVRECLEFYSEKILEGYIVATYNSRHDCKQMRGELRRAGMDDLFEETPNICLMRASTDICKVPKKTGKGWKFPKLSEACAFFKIEPEPTPHNAMEGAIRAMKILLALQALARLPQAEVHYAKERPAEKPAMEFSRGGRPPLQSAPDHLKAADVGAEEKF